MKKQTLLFVFYCLFHLSLLGQPEQRYLDYVFDADEIAVESDVVYGENASFLLAAGGAPNIKEQLIMDVYYPEDDTETERPVVILLHAGDYIPPTLLPVTACYGTRKDAYVEAIARRIARLGYVVCNADYRLGWDPQNEVQSFRVATIINAAYRGVQDSKTAIKFLRRSVAENDNPYGIDSTKVVLWGLGTGAVTSYAAATLNSIEDTYIPKFIFSIDPFVPMIIEGINGDLDVNQVGIAPEDYPPFTAGDTVNYPNHVGYTTDFQLAVQMGGALGDTSWVDASDVPMIGIHVEEDPDNDCVAGFTEVPEVGPVVEVFGACTAIPLANSYGLNESFDVTFTDPISEAVNSQDPWGGNTGLYIMNPTPAEQSATWDFASSSMPYPGSSDCNTDSVPALLVIDSILEYVAPRACLALGLGCDLEAIISDVEEISASQVGLKVFPNPASQTVNISTDQADIKRLQLIDARGRLLQSHTVNHNFYTLKRDQLIPGMYLILLEVESGYISEKIIFD